VRSNCMPCRCVFSDQRHCHLCPCCRALKADNEATQAPTSTPTPTAAPAPAARKQPGRFAGMQMQRGGAGAAATGAAALAALDTIAYGSVVPQTRRGRAPAATTTTTAATGALEGAMAPTATAPAKASAAADPLQGRYRVRF
jgi:hypothetical protein